MIFGSITELGIALADLVSDHSDWSRATFGPDGEVGPLGALRHLEKEAKEAQESPGDVAELADCLLLILDASRRSGIKVMQLIEAAQEKMKVNKDRTWPAYVKDQPCEHVKEGV